jgi:hypothetical protein
MTGGASVGPCMAGGRSGVCHDTRKRERSTNRQARLLVIHSWSTYNSSTRHCSIVIVQSPTTDDIHFKGPFGLKELWRKNEGIFE